MILGIFIGAIGLLVIEIICIVFAVWYSERSNWQAKQERAYIDRHVYKDGE